MPPSAVVPRRWHLYIVDLEPRVGTKPGKQRPCLAIQPREFGEGGLPRAGICRLTKDSDVLVDQILAWDNELFRTDLGVLPEALQDEIRRALLEFLDVSRPAP